MQHDVLGPIYFETDTFRLDPLREMTDAEKSLVSITKQRASELRDAILSGPASRERSAALTKLEEAVFWAIKGVTA